MDTMTSSASIEKEHITWLKHLDFYKAQLVVMEKELALFAKESTSKKVGPKVEQFQNQFIRQRDVIDTLKHNVKQHENEIERMTRFALEPKRPCYPRSLDFKRGVQTFCGTVHRNGTGFSRFPGLIIFFIGFGRGKF
jgi:hypothetical protein